MPIAFFSWPGKRAQRPIAVPQGMAAACPVGLQGDPARVFHQTITAFRIVKSWRATSVQFLPTGRKIIPHPEIVSSSD
jgi:hypothetical protein